MADLTTVARPYAKAAFEHAIEVKQLAEWSELLSFTSQVVSDTDMQQLLNSPHFTKQDRCDAMLSVCVDIKDTNAINFLKLLAQHGRLIALPEIEALFNFLRKEFEKAVDVTVTSATELSETQVAQIKEKLGVKLGRQVEVSVEVDVDLLGGLIIKAEDLVIDGSVRGQLAKLSDALNE